MLVKKTLLFLFLILSAFCQSLGATDTELQVGKTLDGTLSAGKSDSYTLALKAGDFVETNVVISGTKLMISVYGPSGGKIRGFRFTDAGRKFHFVADEPGEYRLEVALDRESKNGPYTITLSQILGLAERLAPPPERYLSSRLTALRSAIEAGQANVVEGFWEEVKAKGTPLIEPLKGDSKYLLVTFLWKGTSDTKNVMVMWFPFCLQRPDDYRMTRLGETDVWFRTLPVDKRERFVYQLALNTPPMRPVQDFSDENTMSLFFGATQVDPLNPKHWGVSPNDPDVPLHQGYSAVEMPDAPIQPCVAERKGVPVGKIEKHQFSSALLKNNREIAIYTPPGYSKDAKPYGLIVLFDEKQYLDDKSIPTPTIIDNLIADDRIPPMIAVLVDNVPGARSRELPWNSTFADFLNYELVPWVRRMYNVTTDPQRSIVGGSSYGGLAAAYEGFRHPETFGNILSQSGSYWWTPPRNNNPNDFDPDAEPNWIAKQFITSPLLPLRFYMDAGSDELDLPGRGGALLLANRHLRDVLVARGYDVHYQEFVGGHDYLSWRGTLADGLILLMGSSAESQKH